MKSPNKPDLISVEEYLEGEVLAEVKHEYIGGTVHAMAGATIRHNNICTNALVFFVRETPRQALSAV